MHIFGSALVVPFQTHQSGGQSRARVSSPHTGGFKPAVKRSDASPGVPIVLDGRPVRWATSPTPPSRVITKLATVKVTATGSEFCWRDTC